MTYHAEMSTSLNGDKLKIKVETINNLEQKIKIYNSIIYFFRDK